MFSPTLRNFFAESDDPELDPSSRQSGPGVSNYQDFFQGKPLVAKAENHATSAEQVPQLGSDRSANSTVLKRTDAQLSPRTMEPTTSPTPSGRTKPLSPAGTLFQSGRHGKTWKATHPSRTHDPSFDDDLFNLPDRRQGYIFNGQAHSPRQYYKPSFPPQGLRHATDLLGETCQTKLSQTSNRKERQEPVTGDFCTSPVCDERGLIKPASESCLAFSRPGEVESSFQQAIGVNEQGGQPCVARRNLVQDDSFPEIGQESLSESSNQAQCSAETLEHQQLSIKNTRADAVPNVNAEKEKETEKSDSEKRKEQNQRDRLAIADLKLQLPEPERMSDESSMEWEDRLSLETKQDEILTDQYEVLRRESSLCAQEKNRKTGEPRTASDLKREHSLEKLREKVYREFSDMRALLALRPWCRMPIFQLDLFYRNVKQDENAERRRKDRAEIANLKWELPSKKRTSKENTVEWKNRVSLEAIQERLLNNQEELLKRESYDDARTENAGRNPRGEESSWEKKRRASLENLRGQVRKDMAELKARQPSGMQAYSLEAFNPKAKLDAKEEKLMRHRAAIATLQTGFRGMDRLTGEVGDDWERRVSLETIQRRILRDQDDVLSRLEMMDFWEQNSVFAPEPSEEDASRQSLEALKARIRRDVAEVRRRAPQRLLPMLEESDDPNDYPYVLRESLAQVIERFREVRLAEEDQLRAAQQRIPSPAMRLHADRMNLADAHSAVSPRAQTPASQRSVRGIPDPPRTAAGGGRALRTWTKPDFEIERKIGGGRFGSVFAAREVTRGLLVALKTVSFATIEEQALWGELKREIEIQMHLAHPCVVRLHGFFVEDDGVWLIQEYAAGGSLIRRMRAQSAERFGERAAATYARDIARALRYCHAKGVLHRDLKPENLVLDGRGAVKLTDFGWGVHLVREPRRTTCCGTLDFASPEQTDGLPYAAPSDVWSVGVILYEMLYGSPPFEVHGPGEERARAGTKSRIRRVEFEFPEEPAVSAAAKHLISAILRENPEERIKLYEILIHPWIVANAEPSEDHTIPVQ